MTVQLKTACLTLLFSGTLMLAFVPARGQIGKKFPRMETTTLDDEPKTLPQVAEGEQTLVALASSPKAEEDLRTWIQPLFDAFMREYKNDDWLAPARADHSNVQLYFVPMFAGLNKLARNKTQKNMKENLPEKYHQHMLIYQGTTKPYEKTLEMDDTKKPYFFALNPEGEVIYAASGRFNERKLDELKEALDDNP
jgi:hypothetical protein